MSFIIFYIIFAVCLRASLLLFICFQEKIGPLFTPAICYMTNRFAPLKCLSPSLDDFETNVNWLCFWARDENKKQKQNWEPRERWSWGVPTAHLNLYDFIKFFFFWFPSQRHINGGKGKQNWMANVLIWNNKKCVFLTSLPSQWSPSDYFEN